MDVSDVVGHADRNWPDDHQTGERTEKVAQNRRGSQASGRRDLRSKNCDWKFALRGARWRVAATAG